MRGLNFVQNDFFRGHRTNFMALDEIDGSLRLAISQEWVIAARRG